MPLNIKSNGRDELAAWVDDYNTERPHSALHYKTPAAFAAGLRSATNHLAPPLQGSAIRPVANITEAESRDHHQLQ